VTVPEGAGTAERASSAGRQGPWDPAQLDDLVHRLEASPAIARMSSGFAGTIGTYLPGRRIPGVRVQADGRLEIHVVMAHGASVDDVRAAIADAVPNTECPDVHIDDVDTYQQVG
jgi:hypothetical protein